MYAYYCKGEVFFSQGQLTSAEASYLISLKISEELHEPRYSMLCLIQLSQIEFAKKKYNKSLNHLLRAKEKGNSSEYPSIVMSIYKHLSKVYDKKSDLKNAYLHQSAQIKLLDSLYDSKFINRLSDVQTEYEERENMKALATKDRLVSLQAEALQTQKKISLFIGLIVVLSLIVIATLHRNYKMRLRINKILEEKVKVRTHELEKSRNNALQAAYEQDHRLTRLTEEVLSSLATIQGLCEVARLDDNTESYLKRVIDYTCSIKVKISSHPNG